MNHPAPDSIFPEDALAIPAREDALPSSTRLDEYEIVEVQGEGPLGIVYLAIDHALERRVAIREYLPAAYAGRGEGHVVALRNATLATPYQQGLRAFIDEARLLARVDHPSLVRVLRSWEANHTAYMAMPFYDAPTLREARLALPAPPDEAWMRTLLESLAGGLAELHGATRLHRNLSPDQVLVLRSGRPMLMAPSAALQLLAPRSSLSGIRDGYSSIEEYGESNALPQGAWTDIYALAAVARFCISGDPPPAAVVRAVRDAMQPTAAVIQTLRQQWPGLQYSRALLDTIDRSLSIDPAARPQSIKEFLESLNDERTVILPKKQTSQASRTASTADREMSADDDFESHDNEKLQASLSAMLDAALGNAAPAPERSASASGARRSSANTGDSVADELAARRAAAHSRHSAAHQPPAKPHVRDLRGTDASTSQRGRSQTPPAYQDTWLGTLPAGLDGDPILRSEFPQPDETPRDSVLDDFTFRPTDLRMRQAANRPFWAKPGFGVALAALAVVGAAAFTWQWYGHQQTEHLVMEQMPPTSAGFPRETAAGRSSAIDVHGNAESVAVKASAPALDPRAAALVAAALAEGTTASAARSPTSGKSNDSSTSPSALPMVPAAPDESGPDVVVDTPVTPPVAKVDAPSVVKPKESAPEPARVETRRSERAAKTTTEPEITTPRQACGGRSDFSLYYCMKQQCEKPRFESHAQCRRLQQTDSVD